MQLKQVRTFQDGEKYSGFFKMLIFSFKSSNWQWHLFCTHSPTKILLGSISIGC